MTLVMKMPLQRDDRKRVKLDQHPTPLTSLLLGVSTPVSAQRRISPPPLLTLPVPAGRPLLILNYIQIRVLMKSV